MYKFKLNEFIVFDDQILFGPVYKIVGFTEKQGFWCMENAYKLIRVYDSSDLILGTSLIDKYAISLGFDEELIKLLYL